MQQSLVEGKIPSFPPSLGGAREISARFGCAQIFFLTVRVFLASCRPSGLVGKGPALTNAFYFP